MSEYGKKKLGLWLWRIGRCSRPARASLDSTMMQVLTRECRMGFDRHTDHMCWMWLENFLISFGLILYRAIMVHIFLLQ